MIHKIQIRCVYERRGLVLRRVKCESVLLTQNAVLDVIFLTSSRFRANSTFSDSILMVNNVIVRTGSDVRVSRVRLI